MRLLIRRIGAAVVICYDLVESRLAPVGLNYGDIGSGRLVVATVGIDYYSFSFGPKDASRVRSM